jgi:ubiquitin carboxyl-terminal hydrolase 5/13
MEMAVEWLFSHPDDPGDTAASSVPMPEDVDLTVTVQPKYRLHAVVAHKGSSTHCGHYVAYVRQANG